MRANKATTDPDMVRAAKALAKGWVSKTFVSFTEADGGHLILYDLPQLGSNQVHPAAIYHSPSLYLSRIVDRLVLRDAPTGYDLFDGPAIRFIFLGEPMPGGAGGEAGTADFAPNQFSRWRAELHSEGENLVLKAFILGAGTARRLMIDAHFRRDRSQGQFLRYGNPGVPPNSTRFKRLNQTPEQVSFNRAFPAGLLMQDYRGKRENPETGTWDPAYFGTRPTQGGESPLAMRYFLIGLGVSLAIVGSWIARRQALYRKG